MDGILQDVLAALPDDLAENGSKEFIRKEMTKSTIEGLSKILIHSKSQDGRDELLRLETPSRFALLVWRVSKWWCENHHISSSKIEEIEPQNDDEFQNSGKCVVLEISVSVLRILRNLCVAGPPCQDMLEERGVNAAVGRLAEHLAAARDSNTVKLLVASMQLLGNFGVGNRKCARAAGATLLPPKAPKRGETADEILSELSACDRPAGGSGCPALAVAASAHFQVHPPLCMALSVVVRQDPLLLTRDPGAGVLHILLCRAAHPPTEPTAKGGEGASRGHSGGGAGTWEGGGGEWLGVLLTLMCLQTPGREEAAIDGDGVTGQDDVTEHDLLPSLFLALGPPPSSHHSQDQHHHQRFHELPEEEDRGGVPHDDECTSSPTTAEVPSGGAGWRGPQPSRRSFSVAQAALLELLANVLQGHAGRKTLSLSTAEFVLEQLQESAREVAHNIESSKPQREEEVDGEIQGGQRSQASERSVLPEEPSSEAAGVLAGSLSLLRSLAALGLDLQPSIWTFIDLTVVPLACRLLQALGPPTPHHYSQKSGGSASRESQERESDSSSSARQPTPDGPNGSQGFPCQSVYASYRRDIVALLSTASWGRSQRDCTGGLQELLQAILAHCGGDADCPFVREWAIFGVRNLCEGNPAIQDEIRQMEVLQVVDDPQFQNEGLRAELNSKGRPHFVKHT